jgi:hypothetical protein
MSALREVTAFWIRSVGAYDISAYADSTVDPHGPPATRSPDQPDRHCTGLIPYLTSQARNTPKMIRLGDVKRGNI